MVPDAYMSGPWLAAVIRRFLEAYLLTINLQRWLIIYIYYWA